MRTADWEPAVSVKPVAGMFAWFFTNTPEDGVPASVTLSVGVRTVIVLPVTVVFGEIWLVAKSGGFHFRPQEGRWVGTRDGEDFYAVLSRCMGEQAGVQVRIAG